MEGQSFGWTKIMDRLVQRPNCVIFEREDSKTFGAGGEGTNGQGTNNSSNARKVPFGCTL